MAICLDPFCLIMERFYHTTLSFYLRDPNMDMEKDLECHLMRIIRIILDVAQALSHLHRKNWIHCHVSSRSILVCDGPRAKLGSLEFCERPGAAIEFMECFQEELPWLAPELLAVGEARFPADIYSLAATFWECLTRSVPWSWLSEKQIPAHRQLPILLCWPSLIKHLVAQCLDEADRRPTADVVCRKLGEFARLGIWLDRYQLDDIFKRWLAEHRKNPSEMLSSRTSASSRSDIVTIALGEKYSSSVQGSRTSEEYKERAYNQTRRRSVLAETGKPKFRRRSAVVTTLVEEALTTIAQVGRPIRDVREADIYKFGFKLAREIAELRGICQIAIQRQRKAWAKVAMATRDLEEDMFDSLAGYEEVTFRRKHAHAANLKKHHQEKEEEKLKESLDRKKSLIKKHKRKNWACYTILLFELYGILRRRDTIVDNGEEDIEQEVLNQSIARISSQMTRLSNIVVDTMDDNVSGKFSLFPIDVTQLARQSDDSVKEVITSVYDHDDLHDHVCDPTSSNDGPTDPENAPTDLENAPTDYENAPTDPEDVPTDPENAPTHHENVPTDPENVPTNPKNVPTDTENVPADPENIPTYPDDTPADDCVETTDTKKEPASTEVEQNDVEVGTTSEDYTATGADESLSAYNSARNKDYNPPSPDGSATFLDDTPAETSTPRMKSKTRRIRNILKRRKTKKQGRKGKYMESSV
ncbi:uncharacterized protein LOC114517957 [Dendronephthya gigantea]|uniref:uncharacterized protein LOC114517957 n=1 Tax=Dendronephthya gigantea TaxID=151771 RepID=UPI00106BB452|nr:uncharacterized protein LOC114517957 [Dendronephthya gigantea]